MHIGWRKTEVASFTVMEGDWLLKYIWMRLVIYLLTIQTKDHFFFFPQDCVWLSLSNRSVGNFADPLPPPFLRVEKINELRSK